MINQVNCATQMAQIERYYVNEAVVIRLKYVVNLANHSDKHIEA